MSGPDYDTRFEEAAREKWLEERDNKPVLEFDFKRYVIQRIELLDECEINTAEFVASMFELQCLISDLDAANAEIAELLAQSKRVELIRARCNFQLRRLMEMEGLG